MPGDSKIITVTTHKTHNITGEKLVPIISEYQQHIKSIMSYPFLVMLSLSKSRVSAH